MSLEGMGALLKHARVTQHLSLEALAETLHWPPELLQAVEEERWERVPPGQERPMVRQMASQLGVTLETHEEAWAAVPGIPEQVPPHPRHAKLERLVSAGLGVGSLLLVAWLLIPGRDLKEGTRPSGRRPPPITAVAAPPAPIPQPYPVLGEAIPEAPVTAEGVLVVLRAIDTCGVRIEGGETPLEQTLGPSEPWRVRVRAPFALFLDNAGVVGLEVAGRSIRHACHVGERWTGRFDAQGQWILPPAPSPEPGSAPPEPVDEVTETP